MTNGTKFFHLVCLLAVMLTMAQPHSLTYAQAPVKPTTIKGVVVDSLTREPIPFAMVLLQGSSAGTQADADGRFDIMTKVNFLCANFSMMGYAPKDIYVSKGEVNDLTVELSADGVALKEFVVRPGKEHYSRKNNPAVQFMEKLRDMKEKYDPRNHDYYSYDKYEKMNFALNDFSEKNKDKWLFKKFKFIFEYMDTSEVSGKPILNVSVKEKLSTAYFRRSPHAEKEFVKGIKRAGVDEIFDEESVQRFLEDVFKEVDIFDNDIAIMQNRFVSPLSKIGSGFYKYYLSDTIPVDGVKCIELSFAPFNNRTFGFFGRIYVPLGDSTMFVKKVVMNVPRDINLNYVNNLRIEQTFDKAPDGCRIKTKDDMTVEFSIIPSSQGLYARRRTLYENFSFDKPENDGIFNEEAKLIEATDARQMPDEYWKENRMTPIKEKENAIDKLLTQLRSVPAFYWTEKTISVLVSGYIPTGDKNTSKFDFGQMNTTISGNTVEGARLKVGGMTTANLSKHWFMKGYTAYGFRDKKWKYDGEVEYSFNEKKYHAKEFPIHSLRLHHKYDINQLGQQYMFTNMDNVFLAWKRQTNDKVTYLRTSGIQARERERACRNRRTQAPDSRSHTLDAVCRRLRELERQISAVVGQPDTTLCSWREVLRRPVHAHTHQPRHADSDSVTHLQSQRRTGQQVYNKQNRTERAETLLVLGLWIHRHNPQGRQSVEQGVISRPAAAQRQPVIHNPTGIVCADECDGIYERPIPFVGYHILDQRSIAQPRAADKISETARGGFVQRSLWLSVGQKQSRKESRHLPLPYQRIVPSDGKDTLYGDERRS